MSDESKWKKKLTPEQYYVLREKGTERPFTGEHISNKRKGIYKCAGCEHEIFSSEAKFDSGCGWPSFDQPASMNAVDVKTDLSHFMIRTEVICPKCGGHLGHVFDDGPTETGLRYCINSVALSFKEKLVNSGKDNITLGISPLTMREMWVRGIFFRQVLEYIRSNRGKTTYELLERKLEDYIAEEKYDFSDFAELLLKVKLISAHEVDYITHISRDLMSAEASWKNLFRRMDPASVFASTQRQEGRHQLAYYEPIDSSDNQVILKMNMWTDNRDYQDLWAEFYRGRLEGILDIMGRKGNVKMVREFGPGSFSYTINWD